MISHVDWSPGTGTRRSITSRVIAIAKTASLK
jgi:hypothetical protein